MVRKISESKKTPIKETSIKKTPTKHTQDRFDRFRRCVPCFELENLVNFFCRRRRF